MKNYVGNPVKGGDFFDRIREQERAWEILDTDHVLLLAPRRVGKTSLMERLRETAPAHNHRALQLSIADICDEADLVRRLFEALRDGDENRALLKRITDGPLGKLFKRAKVLKGGGLSIEFEAEATTSWRQLGEALTRTLDEADGHWLIGIDELPVFLLKLLKEENGTTRAREFLYWFRNLRQGHDHIRWILAGSIGLDTVVGRLGLGDTINDLRPLPLGAFSPSDADRLLARLADSYQIPLDEAVRQHIIRRIEWPLPYYLQALFATLRDLHHDEGAATIDATAADRAFEQLLDPAHKNYFDYWRQRLGEELGRPDDHYALVLLNTTCRDPAGATFDTLRQRLAQEISDPTDREERLNYLLDVLINDGYLVESEGRFRFRMGLLREYWQRRVAR